MFTLYKSSAGSGKTFTLVKEYLKLCLTNPAKYPRVLAITFTNKAAAEMKNRIIESLHTFLSEGKNAIVDRVIEETGMDHEAALQNARQLQTQILHAYSDFSVMTIDSFISRIVRTFARDLDMPLKFDVELDTGYITAEVIEKLMAEAEAGHFLGDVLTQFALSKIHSTGSWNVDGELAKLGQVTFGEKYIEEVHFIGQPQYDEPFWRDLIHDIDAQIQQFRRAINDRAKEALSIIERHDLKIEDFFHGEKGPAGSLKRYSNAINLDDFRITSRFQDMVWVSKNKDQQIKSRIESALAEGVERLANEILDLLRNDMPRLVSHILVQKNIYAEALIHQFMAFTDVFKEEKNSVPLTDFSRKVSDVIVNEPVPFLYWRLGNQYSHILIDEFQDTSILQWTNLLPLIEESLAKGQFNMAVGDGKQAIYRWRAGDVRIMEQNLPQVLGGHVENKTLAANYRSRKEIVQFNNAFFKYVATHSEFQGADLFRQLYGEEGAAQDIMSNLTGYVQIQSVDLETCAKKEDRQTRLLDSLVADIQRILLEGNGYGCQDIAVLVRNNSEAQVAAQALFKAGYDVISPDSLRLKSSAVVRFVINTLRYAMFGDPIALLAMWLYFEKDSHEFHQQRRTVGGMRSLEKTLSARFYNRKRFMLQLPVYEAVEEVVEIFELNRTDHGFLQGLLEVILNYSDKFSSDISGFLTWWDAHCDSDQATLPASGQANAVTLSTIHKAKGLEFPVVMIPFAWDVVDKPNSESFLWVESDRIGSKGQPFYYMADVQKKLADSWFADAFAKEQMMSRLDNINLLYVAFTRASDRLYLCIPEEPAERKEKPDTADLIREALGELPLARQNGCRVLGEPSPKVLKKKEEASEKLERLPGYGWRTKITVKKRARELWRLDESDRTAKVDQGILMHEILEQIRTEADILPSVEGQVRLGQVSQEESNLLAEQIQNVMRLPAGDGTVADWFRPGLSIKNEKTIAFGKEEYRPDRVIINGQDVIVVDYKTGQKMAEHHDQILSYGNLLKTMGYGHVRLFLLYLEAGEAEEVLWNS